MGDSFEQTVTFVLEENYSLGSETLSSQWILGKFLMELSSTPVQSIQLIVDALDKQLTCTDLIVSTWSSSMSPFEMGQVINSAFFRALLKDSNVYQLQRFGLVVVLASCMRVGLFTADLWQLTDGVKDLELLTSKLFQMLEMLFVEYTQELPLITLFTYRNNQYRLFALQRFFSEDETYRLPGHSLCLGPLNHDLMCQWLNDIKPDYCRDMTSVLNWFVTNENIFEHTPEFAYFNKKRKTYWEPRCHRNGRCETSVAYLIGTEPRYLNSQWLCGHRLLLMAQVLKTYAVKTKMLDEICNENRASPRLLMKRLYKEIPSPSLNTPLLCTIKLTDDIVKSLKTYTRLDVAEQLDALGCLLCLASHMKIALLTESLWTITPNCTNCFGDLCSSLANTLYTIYLDQLIGNGFHDMIQHNHTHVFERINQGLKIRDYNKTNVAFMALQRWNNSMVFAFPAGNTKDNYICVPISETVIVWKLRVSNLERLTRSKTGGSTLVTMADYLCVWSDVFGNDNLHAQVNDCIQAHIDFNRKFNNPSCVPIKTIHKSYVCNTKSTYLPKQWDMGVFFMLVGALIEEQPNWQGRTVFETVIQQYHMKSVAQTINVGFTGESLPEPPSSVTNAKLIYALGVWIVIASHMNLGLFTVPLWDILERSRNVSDLVSSLETLIIQKTYIPVMMTIGESGCGSTELNISTYNMNQPRLLTLQPVQVNDDERRFEFVMIDKVLYQRMCCVRNAFNLKKTVENSPHALVDMFSDFENLWINNLFPRKRWMSLMGQLPRAKKTLAQKLDALLETL